MKFEKKENQLLFTNTELPDIFFIEYLPQMQGDYLKIYLYMIFLSKYNKEIKLNDLSKKLELPIKTISEGFKFLEELNLVTKKTTGYILNNIQEMALHNLYNPKVALSKETIENNSKNKYRAKAIENINDTYFQGIMSAAWYSDIDLWFKKYGFDEQVMIALFGYCHNRSALHRNYIQAVAEGWSTNGIKTFDDLDIYFQKQEKLNKLKKDIARKLGKHSGLTQYEEAYIEKWTVDYGYDFEIIEIALKRTTYKANPSFEYLNNLISDWYDRGFKTAQEIQIFLDDRKKQTKDIKKLEKNTKATFAQRNYDDLDFLYNNKE